MIKVKGVHRWQTTGALEAQQDAIVFHQDRGIFVLADGFGAGPAGSKAAWTACEAVQNYLVKEAGDPDATLPFVLRNYYSLAGNVLFNALVHANRSLIKNFKETPLAERGGASVIAGYLDGSLLAIAQTGLCEAYLVRASGVKSLVQPRSYLQLVDPFGQLTGQKKRGLQVPMSALGMGEGIEPEIFEYRVEPGDLLVFASDGVELSEPAFRPYLEEIYQLGLESKDLHTITQGEGYRCLVGRECYDNASILLAFLE